MHENARFCGHSFARSLPGKPGVYRLLAEGKVIYVGKARNLKKRVASYFRSGRQLGAKIAAMVAQVTAIEVTVTHTENEALILESNQIKDLKPRYNVVLRDDKSYPYIYLSTDQEFPRISFHRGARSGKGRYFGPYPSAGAVRSTLSLLQKLFMIRLCEDSFFRNRTRPCLQYQIKRCTAPCVGLIDADSYREDMQHAQMFLEGRNQEVIEALIERMTESAAGREYERAARYRDQIYALQRVQQKQYISAERGDLDIVACAVKDGIGAVQVFFIRKGHNLGNKTFFPRHPREDTSPEILAAFLSQYYLAPAPRAERQIPAEIICNHALDEFVLLSEVLSGVAQKKVRITFDVRGERARWLQMAVANAEIAALQRAQACASYLARFDALREALQLEPIKRIECFDVSHTGGEAAVASCVVFGQEGPIKSAYRRFNIKGVAPGDDYAAMHEALTRCYTRRQREEAILPDLVLIDGGKGQVTQAREVLEKLQLNDLSVIGVAKGQSRKPGLETLVLWDGSFGPRLAPQSEALHLIQEIRDEAHRFAITGHRQRRAKRRSESPLEHIGGIGRIRRQRLMQHFGGLQGVERAGVEDLTKVPGISRELAQKIYDNFHGSR